MIKEIDDIIKSLNELAESILNTHYNNRTKDENIWNYSPFSINDLANLASNIAIKLSNINIQSIDEYNKLELKKIPKKNLSFITKILPLLLKYPDTVVPSYFSLIQWISNSLEPLFILQILKDNHNNYKQIKTDIPSIIQTELNKIIPKKDELQSHITIIEKATKISQNLPIDLEKLNEIRKRVNDFSTESTKNLDSIKFNLNSSTEKLKFIENNKVHSDNLIIQVEDAYNITTTKGLAGAFEEKAKSLKDSMWLWVAFLFIVLIASGVLGYFRNEAINEAIKNNKEINYIWVEIFLSLLSLGAPIWFAWIATKQIGQRFKLSEDYAFKSTVAKAYVGYRKEATNFKDNLDKKLFETLLKRLDESPIRLMDKENHGGPLQDVIKPKQSKNDKNEKDT